MPYPLFLSVEYIDVFPVVPGDQGSEVYLQYSRIETQHGVVGEESIVKFTIKPPFWKSKLAICIYLLLIALFIIKNRYEVKKLDRLVSERTNDLRIEMEKNEALFKKVLKLEQNKNNYFVNLSHELRNPLNVLCSISQLIRNISKKDMFITHEKLSYYMEIMDRNTSRLLKLINNIIDNTKIENNSYVLNKEDIDIVYLVEDIVTSIVKYIEGKNIDLIFDTEFEEIILACDSEKIERIILNLISNSIKYTIKEQTRHGKIEVDLSVRNNEVLISVKDNGIGISKEEIELIFNNFKRVDNKLNRKTEGSGIGLSLVKALVEMHKGKIWAESEVGKGTKIVFSIPIKTVNEYSVYNNEIVKLESTEKCNLEFSDIYEF